MLKISMFHSVPGVPRGKMERVARCGLVVVRCGYWPVMPLVGKMDGISRIFEFLGLQCKPKCNHDF